MGGGELDTLGNIGGAATIAILSEDDKRDGFAGR
jgi:hypothetical protein